MRSSQTISSMEMKIGGAFSEVPLVFLSSSLNLLMSPCYSWPNSGNPSDRLDETSKVVWLGEMMSGWDGIDRPKCYRYERDKVCVSG